MAQLAEDLEERVIKACRDPRELLESMDFDLQEVFDLLNVDDDLRERDRAMSLHCGALQLLESLRHVARLLSFGRDIQKIEQDRTAGIKDAVSTLIFDLVSVSYLLRPEIHIVEAEAHLANKVIITHPASSQ